MMRPETFYELIGTASRDLEADEILLASLRGEQSDFVRFNGGRIRQAGAVQQCRLHLDLIRGRRHAGGRCELSGQTGQDRATLKDLIAGLRRQLPLLPEDPYLHFNRQPESRETIAANALPDSPELAAEICSRAKGLDLVGFLAAGTTFQGFANSLGQRNWSSRASFNFDWSCYLRADKAVKDQYAGVRWSSSQLLRQLEQNRQRLELLGRPPRALIPGLYRVCLAPAALHELLQTLSWNGFGAKSQRTRRSALVRLVDGAGVFHPGLQLSENNAGGIAPDFTSQGFIKPERVELIRNGRHAGCLVDSRSAAEFGLGVNAASEIPQSLEMAPGELESAELLPALDKGIYISNLWYTNFSDANACRLTGMTRFACFWVENGRIIAPIEPMRFDQSLYKALGENLEALTREQTLIFANDTYQHRSVASMRLPGILVRDFTLTL